MAQPTIEDVANYGNLVIAHAGAKRNKKHSYALKHFEAKKDYYLHHIESSLLSGEYYTSKYSEKVIVDMRKERLISRLPYYPDRIVHWALMNILAPIMINDIFSPNTHAAIPNRGIHSALKETRTIVLQHPELKYCLKLDIRKYFENINQSLLKSMFRDFTSDERLLKILDENVDSYYRGIPIGNYTSQYWANLYLTPFDRHVEELGLTHVRYMDDVIVFGESSELLHKAVNEIEHYLNLYLYVGVKHNWQIFPIDKRGIDFAGYRVYPNRVLIRKTTFRGLRRRLLHVRSWVTQTHELTVHDRSVVASYAGWAKCCTRKARHTIYETYFKPILELITYSKFTKNITRLFT